MLVDSHCHLNLLDGDDSLEQILSRAAEKEVKDFLTVCCDLSETQALRDITDKHRNIWMSVGVHPNEKPGEDIDYDTLLSEIHGEKVVAVGETGLDFYRSEASTEWQQTRFRKHIHAAREKNLPLIIHSRDAKAETIHTLTQEEADQVGGVMHCFTEDWDMAKQALDLGFYISFSGIVTFKNATKLQEVAQKVPADRMLVETDCPYLSPEPHRGKPNEPANVYHVAEFIAKLRGESLLKVAEQTTENFFRLFSKAIPS